MNDINSFLNPLLIAVVGFFILRLIKTFDDLNKSVFELRTQMKLMQQECDRVKEEFSILKRDQASIWRNIDNFKKGACDGRHSD
jgi:hypothetical protein